MSEEVPNGRRLGLNPKDGLAVAEVKASTADTASPSDLDQAIQAAIEDVRRTGEAAPGQIITLEAAICVAVEAAAPILTQALRDKVAEYEHAITWDTHCLSCAKLLDASIADHQRAEKAEDKVADLEVHAAELHEVLGELFDYLGTLTLSPRERASINVREPQVIEARVRAALAVQPPQHRRQLVGYQTADGRLYRPEDITLVYVLDQGEAQGGDSGG